MKGSEFSEHDVTVGKTTLLGSVSRCRGASIGVVILLVTGFLVSCSTTEHSAGRALENAGSAIQHTGNKLWKDPVPEDEYSALGSGTGKVLENAGDAAKQTSDSVQQNRGKLWDTAAEEDLQDDPEEDDMKADIYY